MRQKGIRNAIREGLRGLGLLLFGILALYYRHLKGWPFLKEIRDSNWSTPAEWAAAWYSLNLIFLALGLAMLIDCLVRLLILRKAATAFVSLLSYLKLLPALGLLLGLYCLLKAML